jgi:hypothetical protein
MLLQEAGRVPVNWLLVRELHQAKGVLQRCLTS